MENNHRLSFTIWLLKISTKGDRFVRKKEKKNGKEMTSSTNAFIEWHEDTCCPVKNDIVCNSLRILHSAYM